jgi:hypothetical protein
MFLALKFAFLLISQNGGVTVLTVHNNNELYEMKREIKREVRHIFNVVRQFTYVHRSATIFNNMR